MRTLHLLVAICAVAIVAPPASAAQEKLTEREVQLLKELTGVYTFALEDSLGSFEKFWTGLRKGPEKDTTWAEVARYHSMRYAVGFNDEHLFFDQLVKLMNSVDDRGLLLLLRTHDALEKYETATFKRLEMATAAASAFTSKYEADLKSAGIKTEKLSDLLSRSQKEVEKRKAMVVGLRECRVVTVKGDAAWESTGIKVKEGEKVYVLAFGLSTASGQSSVYGGQSYSPEGAASCPYPDTRVAKNAPYESLIGKVEGMELDFVKLGSWGSWEADRNGYVMLRLNSDAAHHRGLTALVAIEKRTKPKKDDD